MYEFMFIRFFLLLCGHALADYPLQTDFIARGKNWNTPMPGAPWYYIMTAHCLVHSCFVFLLTGSIWLALAELILHFALDCAKCANLTNIHHDQLGHVLCKVAWTILSA